MHVLEGTCEETEAHDAELTGQHVRLIVHADTPDITETLPDPQSTVRNQAHLEALLLEGVNSGPAAPMTRKDSVDIREQGLALAVARRTGKRTAGA